MQFGFIKNKGTNNALAFLTNNIFNNIDSNSFVSTTFIDLSRGFDIVEYSILLDDIQLWRGTAVSYIKYYLSI